MSSSQLKKIRKAMKQEILTHKQNTELHKFLETKTRKQLHQSENGHL